MAGTLGIEAWRIKTVAVYEGSVIVEFFIISDEAKEEPLIELQKVKEKLANELVNGPSGWLGAPILEAFAEGV